MDKLRFQSRKVNKAMCMAPSAPSEPTIVYYMPSPSDTSSSSSSASGNTQQDLNAASTPTATPQLPDQGVQNAGQQQTTAAQQASGSGSTVKTSPQGIQQPANTTNSNLQAAQAYGGAQTILTSPQGLATKATTTNKTLLGG
jgi:hypothetical protein